MNWLRRGQIGGHEVANLLQAIGQPLLLGEFVLFERHHELLVVAIGVVVQLLQGAVDVEVDRVLARFLGQHGVHILIRYGRHRLLGGNNGGKIR